MVAAAEILGSSISIVPDARNPRHSRSQSLPLHTASIDTPHVPNPALTLPEPPVCLHSPPLSRFLQFAGRAYRERTRGASNPAAATCRMSASNNDDSDDGDRRPVLSNPFLAAAVGMALLSSDPAVTLAAQTARDAVFPGATAAPPTMLLSATEKKAAEPFLKDLLGEVREVGGVLSLEAVFFLLFWGSVGP